MIQCADRDARGPPAPNGRAPRRPGPAAGRAARLAARPRAGGVVRHHPRGLPVAGEHDVGGRRPPAGSSDASPTRPECAVIRRSTPAAAAAAVNRNPTICGDSGTTRSPGSGHVAARSVRIEREKIIPRPARQLPAGKGKKSSRASPAGKMLPTSHARSAAAPQTIIEVRRQALAEGAHLPRPEPVHPPRRWDYEAIRPRRRRQLRRHRPRAAGIGQRADPVPPAGSFLVVLSWGA